MAKEYDHINRWDFVQEVVRILNRHLIRHHTWLTCNYFDSGEPAFFTTASRYEVQAACVSAVMTLVKERKLQPFMKNPGGSGDLPHSPFFDNVADLFPNRIEKIRKRDMMCNEGGFEKLWERVFHYVYD